MQKIIVPDAHAKLQAFETLYLKEQSCEPVYEVEAGPQVDCLKLLMQTRKHALQQLVEKVETPFDLISVVCDQVPQVVVPVRLTTIAEYEVDKGYENLGTDIRKRLGLEVALFA